MRTTNAVLLRSYKVWTMARRQRRVGAWEMAPVAPAEQASADNNCVIIIFINILVFFFLIFNDDAGRFDHP